jgi:hypothetical protein
MEKPELAFLAKTLSDATREYITEEIAVLSKRIESLQELITKIPAGPKGDKGEPGEAIAGPIGPAGKDADIGELQRFVLSAIRTALEAIPTPKDGKDGKDGESIVGPPGKDGQDGKDGASIVGPPGPQGEAGVGPVGPKGDPGAGLPGLDGKDGKDGKDGRDGRDGVGKDGRDGINGRDALDIEILPAIPEKSVPRGTFAQHKGGVWRAIKNTEKPEDWVCVWNGIDETFMTQGEDPREVSITHRLTNGKETVLRLRIPVPIHRGIYADGTEYKQGDCLQFGGSMWMVRAPVTKSKPDERHSDWVLVVRRGRDGKDAANGNGSK